MIIFCVIYLCSVDFVCSYAYTQLATCVGARRTVQPSWCECGHCFNYRSSVLFYLRHVACTFNVSRVRLSFAHNTCRIIVLWTLHSFILFCFAFSVLTQYGTIFTVRVRLCAVCARSHCLHV